MQLHATCVDWITQFNFALNGHCWSQISCRASDEYAESPRAAPIPNCQENRNRYAIVLTSPQAR